MMYTGNSSYCYSNSLHMCLQHAGMNELPDASFFECLTGMPFGTLFLNLDMPMFFPSPAKTDPHTGLSQALETLGWSCELWQGEDAKEAQSELERVLMYGPVLLGPLDMSYLRYDPNHQSKEGGDHFLVVLQIKDGMSLLHDPQFYPYATLPIGELMQAWNATTVGYIESTYTLRHSFQESHKVSREQMLTSTLDVARKFQTDILDGPVAYAGVPAFEQVLVLLEQSPPPAFAGLLIHFALPIGARRSVDAMRFMQEAGAGELAKLYEDKAKLYGSAQYYAATQNWTKVKDNFKDLTEIERILSKELKS